MSGEDERASYRLQVTLVADSLAVISTVGTLATRLTHASSGVVAFCGVTAVAAGAWAMSRAFLRRQKKSAAVLGGLLLVVSGVTGAALDRLTQTTDRPIISAPTTSGSPVPTTSLQPSPAPNKTVPAASDISWRSQWTGSIQVTNSADSIDFDNIPPSHYGSFAGDISTSDDGTQLQTIGTGKVVAWPSSTKPSPQQCHDMTASSPAVGGDSKVLADPQVGGWSCLLTSNSPEPGRIVVFTVAETLDGGFTLDATVWKRH